MKEIIEWKPARLLRDCMRVFGYNNNFTVHGIRYEVDPCSVGKTPLGELAADGAIQMIRQREMRGLKILDIGCGVGIIGLTMFSELAEQGIIQEAVFADINIFNLNSLKRTLWKNNLGSQFGKQLRVYLSDVLEHIPTTEKFDLIVSNPPDFYIEDFNQTEMSGSTLGRYSVGRVFHKSFYNDCHNHLSKGGEVWFIENSDAISESEIKELVQLNSNLEIIDTLPIEGQPLLFWSRVIRK